MMSTDRGDGAVTRHPVAVPGGSRRSPGVDRGGYGSRGPHPNFGILCAFNESAIWALAQYLSESRRLAQRLVPDWTLSVDVGSLLTSSLKAGRFPSVENFVDRKRSKLAASKLPEDVVVSRLTEPIRISGARFRSPGTPLLGQFGWKWEFDLRASKMLRGADVDVLIGMPGASKRAFQRSPRAYKVLHATDPHPRARNRALRQAYGAQAWAELYPRLLVNRMEAEYELADVVLVPSRLAADQMLEYGVGAEKIMQVPYGVDLENFTTRAESVPPVRTGRRPRLIYVGQINRGKGIPLLIEAVRGQDVDLSLAGQIFDRSVVRHLPENVRHLGVLSRTQLAAEYNAHDALVHPTLYDAFGLVVQEAAASGLRVVTTEACGAAEGLGHPHVVVPAGDVPALREAIRSLLVLTDDERSVISQEVRLTSASRCGSWKSYAVDVVSRLDAMV